MPIRAAAAARKGRRRAKERLRRRPASWIPPLTTGRTIYLEWRYPPSSAGKGRQRDQAHDGNRGRRRAFLVLSDARAGQEDGKGWCGESHDEGTRRERQGACL